MTPADQALDQVLAMLLERVGQSPQLALEFSQSEREFFGPDGRQGKENERELAARRHSEWFLLERYSEALQSIPIEAWAHEDPAAGEVAPAISDALQALRQSHCGVFAVTRVSAGEGVWLQDLASGGEFPLREEHASHALEVGDLVVGRLFRIDDLLHRLSSSAGVFRDARLVDAVQADLARAREGRRGVLRISQAELERMFFARTAQGPDGPETLAWAREELTLAGLDATTVEQIFAQLARAPHDPTRWAHGAGDALGDLLDEIAFRTEADLERVRRALLAAWPALHAPAKETPERDAGAGDAGAAIAAFDRGRAEGRDLEELFDELERDLGLDPDDDGDASVVPDFPGVVGAMIAEFLWDTEREAGAEKARSYDTLQSFAEFTADIGVFEDLSERHLLLFCTVWVPENARLASPAQALRLLDALEAFTAWADEQQHLPLYAGFASVLADLRTSLPRTVELNAKHALPPGDGPRGELVQVVDAEQGPLARDGRGREYALPAELAADLNAGDRMRAEVLPGGGLRALCCYPPESSLASEARN